MERFNFKNNGELEEGGAPLFADDFSKLDKRYFDITTSILEGLTDFTKTDLTNLTSKQSSKKSVVLSGVNATTTDLGGGNHELNIDEGFIYNHGTKEILKTEGGTFNYFSSLNPVEFVFVKNETDDVRVMDNGTSKTIKKEESASLVEASTLSSPPSKEDSVYIIADNKGATYNTLLELLLEHQKRETIQTATLDVFDPNEYTKLGSSYLAKDDKTIFATITVQSQGGTLNTDVFRFPSGFLPNSNLYQAGFSFPVFNQNAQIHRAFITSTGGIEIRKTGGQSTDVGDEFTIDYRFNIP
jgi:hypothetical protein